MKKTTIITALVLCQQLSIFAAQLPSVGYEGPYQHHDEREYAMLPDEYYDDHHHVSFTSNGIEPETDIGCDGGKVCMSCIGAFSELPGFDPGNFDDICDAVYYYWAGKTEDMMRDYALCASANCTLSICDGPNPPMGYCPVGTEIPLIFFAFSYLIIRILKKRKNKTN